MSIASQVELTLVGDTDHRQDILDGLQALGAVHLVPLRDAPPESGPDAADDLREAFHYLSAAPVKRRSQRPTDKRPLDEVVREVLDNKYQREDIIDRIEMNRRRRRVLAAWGDFEFPRVEEIDHQLFWFYRVPLGKRALLEAVDLPWQIVHNDQRFHYVVVLSPEQPTEEDIPFRRSRTGALSLSQLAAVREEALVRLEDLDSQRESLTRWILLFSDALDQSLDQRELLRANAQVLDAKQIFALQGWIPEAALPALSDWVDSVPAAYRLREPTVDDNPPTLLLNSDLTGGGQEAVAFFQLPGYRSWDPSRVIFFSFSLFFAMILADAGYAMLLGALLLANWKKMSTPGSLAIRLRNMAAAMLGSAVVYGVLVGSYFGASPPAGSALASLNVLDLNNFPAMMKLSLGVGVVHLLIAHTMVMWVNRRSRLALASLGWILGITGAFLLWLDYMATEQFELTHSPFFWCLPVWLVLVLTCSSDRPVRSAKDVLLQLVDGIAGVLGLTKAFGDVLSYMRLFALGLAGASLAATFNSLAVTARDSVSVGGFLLFALIIIFGHGLNLVLAIMSGVIHGLRLNLMEFYNWGIQGEGYPFKAFAKRGGSKWNH
jgi:V/A-type H+-transporting ATPase subunit I